MKKLKLDLAQIQVLSFTVETVQGTGTVNAHGTEDFDGVFDTTVSTSGTAINMSCASCPYYCFDANTNPDYCGG
jgi:hypothetical protein